MTPRIVRFIPMQFFYMHIAPTIADAKSRSQKDAAAFYQGLYSSSRSICVSMRIYLSFDSLRKHMNQSRQYWSSV